MRKPLVLLGIITAFAPMSTLAQSSGPSGATPDISRSDMAAHDYASQPKDLYDVRNQIRNEEAVRQAQAAQGRLASARPATKDELTAGASVYDKTGIAMARIESVQADGVVVSLGTGKVKVPAEAFGHNKAGLLLDMTKAQFEQVVAQAK
jgi:hypothetical protein